MGQVLFPVSSDSHLSSHFRRIGQIRIWILLSLPKGNQTNQLITDGLERVNERILLTKKKSFKMNKSVLDYPKAGVDIGTDVERTSFFTFLEGKHLHWPTPPAGCQLLAGLRWEVTERCAQHCCGPNAARWGCVLAAYGAPAGRGSGARLSPSHSLGWVGRSYISLHIGLLLMVAAQRQTK